MTDSVKKTKTTSVAEYRKGLEQELVVTCPSGATFKIRRLTPMDYIKEGLADIPNEFFKFIAEFSAGTLKPESEDAKKNIEVFEKFLKITVEKGIIEPPTLIKYDKEKADDHLILAEIKQEDQVYLFDRITGRVHV